MEYFRSSGTSGGLLHSRTQSAYVKHAASEFLRSVGIADGEAIASRRVSDATLERLVNCVREVVSDTWLSREAADERVALFRTLAAEDPPEAIDRVISDMLRRRFPAETERPQSNPRWGQEQPPGLQE